MRTTLLLVVALLVLPMPQDQSPRHDKYASDPDAYCLAGPPLANDTHGHECHCKMTCSPPDASGETHRIEDASCELYCTSSRCLCHGDQSCDGMLMEPQK